MSRFSNDYDEDFPGQGWLWEANLERAMSGAKGQQALRDLEQALLELPEPRLISSHLSLNGQVCAMGALVAHRRCAAGEERPAVLADLAERSQDEEWEWEGSLATAQAGKDVGMTFTLAWHIGFVNDDDWLANSRETPEQRYDRVLTWTRARIIPTAAHAVTEDTP